MACSFRLRSLRADSRKFERMDRSSIVLLVENDPDDARLAELAFERARIPHRLLLISDALEACNYLAGKRPYDDRERFPLPKLILLDLAMPGMNGFELLEHLRGEPGSKLVPITILSGSDYLRDVTRAYQLGANSFLVKPSSLAQFSAALKETVEFWLEGNRTACAPVYLQMPLPPSLPRAKIKL